MAKNYYVSRQWNVTCDVCSKKIKSHLAKQRWDGFIVCPEDFEHRHPQDFVKARIDKITVQFTRPIPELLFAEELVYACTEAGKTAVPAKAVAGCAITGTI